MGGILMVDNSVVAKVTPGVPFTWRYSTNGGNPSSNNTLSVPAGETSEVELTLEADGQSGDTCIFLDIPLSFFSAQGIPISTPEWLQGLTLVNPSKITFKDVNTNQNTRTYRILINAVYNGQPVQSPDPTIVNVGTDGAVIFP
jgi:hypothetical protein